MSEVELGTIPAEYPDPDVTWEDDEEYDTDDDADADDAEFEGGLE